MTGDGDAHRRHVAVEGAVVGAVGEGVGAGEGRVGCVGEGAVGLRVRLPLAGAGDQDRGQ